MLRLMGCVLVIAGCVGVADNICRENKKRLELLKQIRSLYENMKYYIAYQKSTIPEVLRKMAGREDNFFSPVFYDIHQRLRDGNENFAESWNNCMKEALAHSVLKKQERRLVLDFPSCLGYMEENAQANALDELLWEVIRKIEELDREQKNQNKLVMSLGTAAGVLLSILLL